VGPARGTSQNMVKNFMPLTLLEERPAVGIASLLVELSIDFGGKVKRAAGEVACVKDGVHDIMHSKNPKPKSSQNHP